MAPMATVLIYGIIPLPAIALGAMYLWFDVQGALGVRLVWKLLHSCTEPSLGSCPSFYCKAFAFRPPIITMSTIAISAQGRSEFN